MTINELRALLASMVEKIDQHQSDQDECLDAGECWAAILTAGRGRILVMEEDPLVVASEPSNDYAAALRTMQASARQHGIPPYGVTK